LPSPLLSFVPRALQVTRVLPTSDHVTIEASPRPTTAECPACGMATRRIHSVYRRVLHDLPWQGRPVTVRVAARRFRCCTLLMSRACCHHYPGRISGCVSRSLHRRRRPSPLEWRVGSHIDCFEACSMFTHVAARTVRCPPIGAFSRSASGHSSPPDPPRVLPAGARVCRPGFAPGRTVRLGKAHTPMLSSAA
jgi:hypothetical protein